MLVPSVISDNPLIPFGFFCKFLIRKGVKAQFGREYYSLENISGRARRRRRRPQKDVDCYAEAHHGAIVRQYSEIIGKWKCLMWNGL